MGEKFVERPVHVVVFEKELNGVRYIKNLISKIHNSDIKFHYFSRPSSGIKYSTSAEVDLILVSQILTGPDDIETIRQIVLNMRFIPVLVLSTVNDDNLARVVKQSGALFYPLSVDMDVQDLLYVIRTAIEQQKDSYKDQLKSDRLAMMLDTVYDGIVDYDKQTGEIYFNPGFYKLIGLDSKEILPSPESFMNLVHPDDRFQLLEKFKEIQSANKFSYSTEYRLKKKTGEYLWILSGFRSIRWDERGRPVRWLGNFTDITQQKQTEDALLRRQNQQAIAAELGLLAINFSDVQEFLNKAVQSAAAGLGIEYGFITEGLPEKNSYIIRAVVGWGRELENQAEIRGGMESLSGYTVMIGGPVIVEDFYTEKRFKPHYSLLMQNLLSGISVVIAGGNTPYGVLAIYSSFRKKFNKDDVHFLQSIANTVSEFLRRFEVDRALKTGEERLRRFFETANEGIWFLDQNFRIEYLNDRMAQILDAPVEEIIGKHLSEFIPAEGQQAFKERTKNRRQGGNQVFDMRLQRKDGSICWVLVSAAPVFDEQGSFIGSYSMLTDITSQKMAEDALRANERTLKSHEAYLISIFRATPMGIGVVADRIFSDMNDAFCNMVGYTRRELMGQSSRILYLSQEEFEKVGTRTHAPYLFGADNMVESQWKKKTGEIIDVIIGFAPIDPENPDGKVTFSALDITERKKVESSLQRRVQELTILHDIARLAVEASNVEELVQKITEILSEYMWLNYFAIFIIDEEARQLRLSCVRVGSNRIDIRTSIPLGSGITGNVALDGVTRRIPDVSKEPDYIVFNSDVRSEICLPLVVEGQIFGVLNIESVYLDAFSEEDERLLAIIAGQIALAIRRINLNENLKNSLNELTVRNRELSRLYRAYESLLVIGEPDMITIGRVIVDTVLQEFGFSNCSLILRGSSGILDCVARSGHYNEDIADWQLREDGKGLIPLAIRKGEVVSVPDVRDHPDYLSGWKQTRSELVIPLKVSETVIGAIDLQSDRPAAFSLDDERLLSIFAERAALVLENERMFAEMDRRRREFQELYEISRDLAGEHELPALLDLIIHRAVRLLGYQHGAFHLYDPVSKDLELVVNTNPKIPLGLRLKTGDGLAGKVIKTLQPMFIEDYRTWEGRAWLSVDPNMTSCLQVPLLSGGELMGVISLFETPPVVRKYHEEDVRMLSLFASHAAGVVKAARLLVQTRRRLAESEAVSRVSSAMREAETIEEMLPALLGETLTVIKADSGGIALYNTETNRLEWTAVRGWIAGLSNDVINGGSDAFWRSFNSGVVHISRDLIADPVFSCQVNSIIPSKRGAVVVPIKTSRTTVGVMVISVDASHEFSSEDLKLLKTLTEITGNSIQRTRLHLQTELRLHRLTALNVINQSINSSFDLELNYSILLDQLVSQLQVDAACILQYNPSDQSLEAIAITGFLSELSRHMNRNDVNRSLAFGALINRKISYVPDLSQLTLPENFSRLIKEERFVTYHAIPLVIKGEPKGVLETFHRRYIKASTEWLDFLSALAGSAAVAADNSNLFTNLQKSNFELTQAYDETIEGWSRALDLRDHETEGHTRRVVEVTMRLAAAMGMKKAEMTHIRRGALLHDIGKMGVPDQILNKAGALTEAEWEMMHRHPALAYELLFPIDFLRPALDIPYCHHEKWDGSGYPRGLKGQEIPQIARIFAVADVWDALTSDRPYRPAWPFEQALAYIKEQEGKHFDPEIVATFLRIYSEGKIHKRLSLLIIDQDRDSSNLITRALESRLQVVAVSDIEEAYSYLNSPPNFILLDDRSLKKSIPDFLKKVKTGCPSTGIFIMSAYSNNENLSAVQNLGLSANWLLRPLNPDDLYESIIRSAMDKKID